MIASWHSLYLFCGDRDTIISGLQESLVALSYELYDPFGLIPGKAYPQVVRLFVAPVVEGWVRVIGEPDERQLYGLSHLGLCLSVDLRSSTAQIDVYLNGRQTEIETALVPYLRAGYTAADLHRVMTQVYQTDIAPKDECIPLDILPDEFRTMAGQINMKQAQKMFKKLSSKLVRGGDGEAARELLDRNIPDWNGSGGRRLRAVMACLTVPENWREPDFVALRDAYQLQVRRRRNPNAMLYPGDAEALERVRDALDYVPVYGGLSP